MSTKVVQIRFFMRKGSGTFFVYRKFCDESTQSSKRTKAGYHHSDGILPFVLYGAFWVDRCVRRKKGKFWHIGGSLSVGGMVYSAQQIGIYI